MAKVNLTCTVCGDEYRRSESQAENSKYCSRGCKAKDTIAAENKVVKNCDTCGDEFKVQKYREDTARFCSHDCRAEWQKEAFVGENGPNYEGGRRRFYNDTISQTEWNELADDVRERDEWTCQECGMGRDEHEATYGMKLDVHHIKRPEEFETPADAHSMDNLITLCKSCHAMIEAAED